MGCTSSADTAVRSTCASQGSGRKAHGSFSAIVPAERRRDRGRNRSRARGRTRQQPEPQATAPATATIADGDAVDGAPHRRTALATPAAAGNPLTVVDPPVVSLGPPAVEALRTSSQPHSARLPAAGDGGDSSPTAVIHADISPSASRRSASLSREGAVLKQRAGSTGSGGAGTTPASPALSTGSIRRSSSHSVVRASSVPRRSSSLPRGPSQEDLDGAPRFGECNVEAIEMQLDEAMRFIAQRQR